MILIKFQKFMDIVLLNRTAEVVNMKLSLGFNLIKYHVMAKHRKVEV
jgi:hypothetical protein